MSVFHFFFFKYSCVFWATCLRLEVNFAFRCAGKSFAPVAAVSSSCIRYWAGLSLPLFHEEVDAG